MFFITFCALSKSKGMDKKMNQSEIIKEYYKKIPDLLSQTKVSFLIGAGCSLCAGLPLMSKLTEEILNYFNTEEETQGFEKEIRKLLHTIKDTYPTSSNISIEDYLSELQDINAILKRQTDKGVDKPQYNYAGDAYNYEHSEELLKSVKLKIKEILGKEITTLQYHRDFCKAIHYDMSKGRNRTRGTVNYFILNYDTLIEDALAIEKIKFHDGFIGGATAWWNPEKFGGNEYLDDNKKIDARVYKLHGSIDWIRPSGEEFPIRLRNTVPIAEIIKDGEPVVIYPSSMKYKETQYDPYAQMISSFRKALCEFDSHILAVMGYGFNDKHINIELFNGIKNSNGALSVLIFLGTENLPSDVEEWIKDSTISDQILVLGRKSVWKNGSRLFSSEEDIEWYKFEKIVDVLKNGGTDD